MSRHIAIGQTYEYERIMTNMLWVVGLIALAAVVGLAIWVYDPAYRRAWRTSPRREQTQARPALQERTMSEPPAR